MAGTPKLVPNNSPQSLANATRARVDTIANTMSTEQSPSRVYLPGATVEVSESGDSILTYTWVCPDGVTSVQVECYGAAGGGGGGGATAQGGGAGAGGGEYACEPNYPVVPGETYSFFAGQPSLGGLPDIIGSNNRPGMTGLDTVFDPRGKGITGGVIAHGGQGGDQGGVGVPGFGGTGSGNTVHFDGGSGGATGGNVFSDNPWTLLSNLDNLHLWWRMDETTGRVAQDFSEYGRNSVQVYTTTGGFVNPTTSGGQPTQTPVIGPFNTKVPNSFTEGIGWSWKIDRGTQSHGGGYIAAPSFTFGGTGWTTVMASAWIKGLPTASGPTDWGANSASGQHATICGNSDTDAMSNGGYNLSINNSGTATFVVRADNKTYAVTGAGTLSATDGNWHMVTGVFHANTASGMVLYVDGVAVSTMSTNDGSSLVTPGPQPFVVGMDKASVGYYFNGYVSNVYVSREIYNSTQVGEAFGSAVSVGGGGGGGSGGSGGAGNAGVAGSGATGGAGGASQAASQPGINHGASAGGAGGTGANTGGSAGPDVTPYGGAGGGSASYSSAINGVNTVAVPCARSASYCGYDAQGGFAGSLYTISEDPSNDSVDPFFSAAARQDGIDYTGGQSGFPFNGSMNTVLCFPSLASVVGGQNGVTNTYLSDATQWDIVALLLNLTIETPNAATITWSEWLPNNLPSQIDDPTLTTGGYLGKNGVLRIPAGAPGRQVQVPLQDFSAVASDIQSLALDNGHGGQGIGLLLGSLQGSVSFQQLADGAWDASEAPDWYCSFHGAENGDTGLSASLQVQYVQHNAYSAIAGGGVGDPGFIVVSFIDPNGTPVSTVLPSAEQDANGNALGQGFTADKANYNAWKPGSSPLQLETWHPVSSLSNGWVNQGGTCGYKLLPGNLLLVKLCVNGTSATNATIFTLPIGWRPASAQFSAVAVAAGAAITNLFLQVGSDGTVSLQNFTASSNKQYVGTAIVSLDAT